MTRLASPQPSRREICKIRSWNRSWRQRRRQGKKSSAECRGVETCAILTTTPNAVTSAVHDRMPVILDPDSYDVWLDPGMREVRKASDLLEPYDVRRMRCYQVSTRINHVGNDDEECCAPVELGQTQARLCS